MTIVHLYYKSLGFLGMRLGCPLGQVAAVPRSAAKTSFWKLRASGIGTLHKFNGPARRLGVLLLHQRLTVAHSLDHLKDSHTSYLRITLIVQQRSVRRPLDYAVNAV